MGDVVFFKFKMIIDIFGVDIGIYQNTFFVCSIFVNAYKVTNHKIHVVINL